MQRRRGTDKVRDLARGPGRLASALAIDPKLDGIDLCVEGPLWLATSSLPTGAIGRSVRIGISREAHHLRRFYERGNAHVSGARRLNGQRS
jgi:DNA-3-methyladenine glycosylase